MDEKLTCFRLLALFGEQVTMQFLSESTGWADCIMLAMAPVGVITIIVSAIRVGGYRWLKALIGRSTENILAVELEVMTCTSKESCELWNGETVVRCPGAAEICEFICIYRRDPGKRCINSARIMDIQQAMIEPCLLKKSSQQPRMSIPESKPPRSKRSLEVEA